MPSRHEKRKKEGWFSALFGRGREEEQRRSTPPRSEAPRDPVEERRRVLRESGPVSQANRSFNIDIALDAPMQKPAAQKPAVQKPAAQKPAVRQDSTQASPSPQRQTSAPAAAFPSARPQTSVSRTQAPSSAHTGARSSAPPRPASPPAARRPAAQRNVVPEPYRSYYASLPKKPYYPVAVPLKPEPPKPTVYPVREIYGKPRPNPRSIVIPARLIPAPPVFSARSPDGRAPVSRLEPETPREPTARERLIALVSESAQPPSRPTAPVPAEKPAEPAEPAAAPAPASKPAEPAAESAPADVSIWDRLEQTVSHPSGRPAPLMRLSSEPQEEPEEEEEPEESEETMEPVLPTPEPEPEPKPEPEPEAASTAAPALTEEEQAQALAALLDHAQSAPPSSESPAPLTRGPLAPEPEQPEPEKSEPEKPEPAPTATDLPLPPPAGSGHYVYVDNSDDWDDDPFFTNWDIEQFPDEEPEEGEEASPEISQESETAPAEILSEAAVTEPDGEASAESTEQSEQPETPAVPASTSPDTAAVVSAAPVNNAPAAAPPISAAPVSSAPINSTPANSPAPAAQPASQPVFQATVKPIRPAPKTPTVEVPAIPTSLLEYSPEPDMDSVEEELNANGEKLIETLQSFGVRATMLEACRGPAVTRYELQPAAGVKISKITNLSDDIALNLAATGVRIEAPIPGKAAVGIEVPNRKVSTVRMRELIESSAFRRAESPLTTVLGRDIAGELVMADLAQMPHLLIAGSTGSGKSVCINSLIVSLLYKSTPQEVRFLMIDPKVVELGIYNGIPHLIVPVVTDPRKAAGALGWAVTEMLRRYQQFAANNVRDLNSYNRLAQERNYIDEQGMRMEHMPQIVIIIDELADLMMAAPNEVEDSICRLAQMARAAGMHLVIATQRPSVDVITGIIKANIPSRIAFAVSSQVDSRTILDMGGAEKLLGRGDMLFSPIGNNKPTRVQGCFIDDREIEAVVEFIRQAASAEYDEGVMEEIERGGTQEQSSENDTPDGDPMIPEAVRCVVEAGQASTSLLQRRLRLGYARAGRLVDEMEQMGVVGPHEGSKPRQVLITWQQYLEMAQNRGWES
ncbi:DNA translocase FtsK [Anaeromassilibacillus sp. An200]|uniref:DNA translocase FtsK n=1 Tax=Anaeromassilibacillus sp. An200 TaxID=1965587 RepID=UPI001FA8807A|nr:DNA translocase FtsK [Anaeromassilibacillus sp. An200]